MPEARMRCVKGLAKDQQLPAPTGGWPAVSVEESKPPPLEVRTEKDRVDPLDGLAAAKKEPGFV